MEILTTLLIVLAALALIPFVIHGLVLLLGFVLIVFLYLLEFIKDIFKFKRKRK